MAKGSIAERLREGLSRTREQLSNPWRLSESADLDVLEEALVVADIGVDTASEILKELRGRGPVGKVQLRDALFAILSQVQVSKSNDGQLPNVTIVLGVNGVGKTTTVAKLAHRALSSGRTVLVVAGDTFRAAAQEQLTEWGHLVGFETVVGNINCEPASIVHDGIKAAIASGVHEVIIDTAGRLHNKRPLMDELRKIDKVTSRALAGASHDRLLVLDGSIGSNGLIQAREFAAVLPITGIVLTKMDGTAKGGVVVAIARELGLGVCFIGVGETVQDLVEFEYKDFVDAIVDVPLPVKQMGC